MVAPFPLPLASIKCEPRRSVLAQLWWFGGGFASVHPPSSSPLCFGEWKSKNIYLDIWTILASCARSETELSKMESVKTQDGRKKSVLGNYFREIFRQQLWSCVSRWNMCFSYWSCLRAKYEVRRHRTGAWPSVRRQMIDRFRIRSGGEKHQDTNNSWHNIFWDWAKLGTVD